MLHGSVSPGKLHEDFIEDSHAAPPDESIVESFVRTVFTGSILPLKSIFDHVNDTAENRSVINSAHSVGKRKVRTNTFKLCLR